MQSQQPTDKVSPAGPDKGSHLQQHQQKQHHQEHSQRRRQRIQQQLANYRPKRRNSKREPPLVPGPAFAAAIGLAVAACLLSIGGGVCFAKKCNGDTGLGLALLILAGSLLVASVVLFASLPCCFCDESRNCRVRDSCSLRWQRMRRQRRDSRVHAEALTPRPTEGIGGKLGLPAITVRDYSKVETPSSPATGGTPHTGSSTVSFEDASGGGEHSSGGRRNSLPPQLAWCYEGEPADPSRLHPMYGRRRDSWAGAGLTIVDSGDGRLRIQIVDRPSAQHKKAPRKSI